MPSQKASGAPAGVALPGTYLGLAATKAVTEAGGLRGLFDKLTSSPSESRTGLPASFFVSPYHSTLIGKAAETDKAQFTSVRDDTVKEMLSLGRVDTRLFDTERVQQRAGAEYEQAIVAERARLGGELAAGRSEYLAGAGAHYDSEAEAAAAQGMELGISRSAYLAQEGLAYDKWSKEELDRAMSSTMGKQEYISKYSEETFKAQPTSRELGKEFGLSLIPIYGTARYAKQAAEGGWTWAERGLLAASIIGDIAVIVPVVGWMGKAGLSSVAGGAKTAAWATRVSNVGKTLIAPVRVGVYDAPKALLTKPSSLFRGIKEAYVYPFRHEGALTVGSAMKETGSGILNIATGKGTLWPTGVPKAATKVAGTGEAFKVAPSEVAPYQARVEEARSALAPVRESIMNLENKALITGSLSSEDVALLAQMKAARDSAVRQFGTGVLSDYPSPTYAGGSQAPIDWSPGKTQYIKGNIPVAGSSGGLGTWRGTAAPTPQYRMTSWGPETPGQFGYRYGYDVGPSLGGRPSGKFGALELETWEFGIPGGDYPGAGVVVTRGPSPGLEPLGFGRGKAPIGVAAPPALGAATAAAPSAATREWYGLSYGSQMESLAPAISPYVVPSASPIVLPAPGPFNPPYRSPSEVPFPFRSPGEAPQPAPIPGRFDSPTPMPSPGAWYVGSPSPSGYPGVYTETGPAPLTTPAPIVPPYVPVGPFLSRTFPARTPVPSYPPVLPPWLPGLSPVGGTGVGSAPLSVKGPLGRWRISGVKVSAPSPVPGEGYIESHIGRKTIRYGSVVKKRKKWMDEEDKIVASKLTSGSTKTSSPVIRKRVVSVS